MTIKEKNRLFEKGRRIAYKLAKQFSNKYSQPYDEMTAEAIFALFSYINEGWENYDKTKSGESTWIHRKIQSALMDYMRRKIRQEKRFSSMTTFDNGNKDIPAKQSWFEKLLKEVSEEGKFLIRIIVLAPSEIAEDIKYSRPKRAGRTIKQYMIDHLDWSFEKFDSTWKEVQSCL